MRKNHDMTHEEAVAVANEMNIAALAANLADLREKFAASERRAASMENEIGTMKSLIQKQSQVIGQAMQNVMGSGSTERE